MTYSTSGVLSNIDYIGGFVGNSDSAAAGNITIKGSTMSGTISIANAARYVGGFIGKSSCPTVIGDDALGNHSTFAGKIDYTDGAGVDAPSGVGAYGYVGGFIGWKEAQSTSITNCVSTSSSEVKITGGAQRVGGFIALNKVVATFTGNTFGGKIEYNSNGSMLSGNERVGGFIGDSQGATAFANCNSNGTITVPNGAQSVGGLVGILAGANTFTDCNFMGKIDYTVYTGTANANGSGRIGGFVGESSGTFNTTFLRCNVTSVASITSNDDVSTCGGFIGTEAGNETFTFTNCNYSGTLTHYASKAVGQRRYSGFVAEPRGSLTFSNCIFTSDGKMYLYERGQGSGGFGGFLGIAVGGCTYNITSCSFSGTAAVYCQNDTRQTWASGQTNVFGTVIGTNSKSTTVSIDETSYTTLASYNFAGTSVNFLLEP